MAHRFLQKDKFDVEIERQQSHKTSYVLVIVTCVLHMYIQDGREVHMIQKFFWRQLQIKMLDFHGHLALTHNINIKLCLIKLTKMS